MSGEKPKISIEEFLKKMQQESADLQKYLKDTSETIEQERKKKAQENK